MKRKEFDAIFEEFKAIQAGLYRGLEHEQAIDLLWSMNRDDLIKRVDEHNDKYSIYPPYEIDRTAKNPIETMSAEAIIGMGWYMVEDTKMPYILDVRQADFILDGLDRLMADYRQYVQDAKDAGEDYKKTENVLNYIGSLYKYIYKNIPSLVDGRGER